MANSEGPELVPEVLPPDQNSIRLWRWTVTRTAARVFKAAISIPCIGLAGWLLQNFLQLRGVVDLLASRIDLAFLWVALFIAVFVLTIGAKRQNLWRSTVGLALLLVVFGLDWWAPKPKPPVIPYPSPDVGKPTLAVLASLYPVGQLPGDYAGIRWKDNYVPVVLILADASEVPIESLDAIVSMDTSIAATGRLSGFPDWSCRLPPQAPQEVFALGESGGQPTITPTTPSCTNGSIMPAIRIVCQRLLARESARIVLASVATNSATMGRDGRFDIPRQLFASKRNPTVIRVNGNFITGPVDGSKRCPIKYEGQIKPVL